MRSRRSSPGAGAWTMWRRTRSCGCRWSGGSRRSSSRLLKDDLTTLLAACNPKTYVGSRMRAMILFLLDTGVRSSELVSIELCDVLFDEGRVRVLNGKGRKQRWTAISEVALAALRTYLEDFRGWSEGHLFQTFDGRPLRNHHMNVMFTRHG